MSLLGPMHGACTAGSGGVDVSGRLDLVLRDKAALARAGGSIALRHHGAVTVISRVFKSFSLISNVAPLSLQSMVSLTSPPKEIRRQPALRLLPRVTFAVTVVSSFDNAMFGASGSPQIFSDGDAADSALQLILLWL